MFHIIDFVNTCVHRQSPPVVLHSQPHGTLVQQKCPKSSRHLDTVQFSCPSSALVTLVHCDGHSRFITVSKSLWRCGKVFSADVNRLNRKISKRTNFPEGTRVRLAIFFFTLGYLSGQSEQRRHLNGHPLPNSMTKTTVR